ncbi:pesticin C-terminus-like muramidase [Pseudoxanthomonas sp. JBR18]|uniref:pesticin C-terminus-like muramidase n=1 Tax=Pseudoxanthomonas sp. JBR18 TaxID=2969308 RepID=UPI00230552C4|nr:pesticin C-terminus-like muramidase [Pseudoxanthomonas sp. JBR18]WCE03475.1 pesticin C-terminus-like muramidase [Pseudoxanthomonas sp. JBR18]
MDRRKLSVAILIAIAGFIEASSSEASQSEIKQNIPSTNVAQNTTSDQVSLDPETSALGTEMRPLTVEEVELIMGANDTSDLPPVVVTTAPPGGDPGGPSGPGDGSGNPGSGGGGSFDPDHCYTPLASAIRTDSSYIFANEGGVKTDGYTLSVTDYPNSGVTIGAGVDLGQQSAAGLTALNVPQNIINTLTPFFGLKGQDAVNAIAANGGPPVLTTPDATTLSNILMASTTTTVSTNFDAATSGMTFGQLPEPAQTVIVDASYPSGPNLASSAPNFWGEITSGRWADAENELNHWYSNGTTDPRHAGDATKLGSAITAKSLPSDSINGQCP